MQQVADDISEDYERLTQEAKEEDEEPVTEIGHKEAEDDGEKFPPFINAQVLKIANALEKELMSICHGTTRFKHEHEKCCQPFLNAAFEYLHLAILTNKLRPDKDDYSRSLILQHVFKILVDALLKDLSTYFIANLRDRLLYEISLIEKLQRRDELNLVFGMDFLKPIFEAMVKYFDKLFFQSAKADPEQVDLAIKRWSGMRNVLNFFFDRRDIDTIVQDYERKLLRISKAPFQSEVLTWFHQCLVTADEIGSKLGSSVGRELKETKQKKRRVNPLLADYLQF